MTNTELPVELFSEEIFTPIRPRISYYVKNIDNYMCHLFCVKLDTIKELTTYWETLSAVVASNFQSQLENDIELWNIYIIFFINDNITREVKYEIEQDKYSSRKIVFDYSTYSIINDDEEKLVDLLEKKLFILQSKVIKNSNFGTSEDIIKKNDPLIIEALNSSVIGNKKDSFYEHYVNLKNGE